MKGALGCLVKRLNEGHGATVGEDAGFHLVHDVGETDSAFGIGERDAAACAWVAEGLGRGAEGLANFLSVFIQRIAHEAEGERGGHEEDAVWAGGLWSGVCEDSEGPKGEACPSS